MKTALITGITGQNGSYLSFSSLFPEPYHVIQEKLAFPEDEPEMTEFELSFLCGLIREKRPKKIVEVGVAAGGTTAVILECLSVLGMNETTEVHSVDVSELFYRGDGGKTGYLAEEYKRQLHWQGNHRTYLGKFLPEVMSEIGQDVDFVILDTAHQLPGEVLDFLTVFPYMKPRACVVLHDIALNHYDIHPESFATQVLLDSVVADKCLVKDSCREYGYPNIGGFFINEDTGKYLANVFHALIITWNYVPERSAFDLYLESYEKNYAPELIELANVAYELQKGTLLREQIRERKERVAQEAWRHSNSYKIGRMITFLPRWIMSVFEK
jgi:predicted O-methyltransferase YrrM